MRTLDLSLFERADDSSAPATLVLTQEELSALRLLRRAPAGEVPTLATAREWLVELSGEARGGSARRDVELLRQGMRRLEGAAHALKRLEELPPAQAAATKQRVARAARQVALWQGWLELKASERDVWSKASSLCGERGEDGEERRRFVLAGYELEALLLLSGEQERPRSARQNSEVARRVAALGDYKGRNDVGKKSRRSTVGRDQLPYLTRGMRRLVGATEALLAVALGEELFTRWEEEEFRRRPRPRSEAEGEEARTFAPGRRDKRSGSARPKASPNALSLLPKVKPQRDLSFRFLEVVFCSFSVEREREPYQGHEIGPFSVWLQGIQRGLPFGQDRLIVLWLAAAFYAAGKPSDNVIRYRSHEDILAAFHLPQGEQAVYELLERLFRFFDTSYSLQDMSVAERGGFFYQSYQVLSSVSLSFPEGEEGNELARQRAQWSHRLRLSPHFTEDLLRCEVPIHLEHIRALRDSPAALDLYVFESWRSHWLAVAGDKEPLAVPVFGEGGLLEKLGGKVKEASEAKKLLCEWHAQVRAAWPECKNELSLEVETLLIRPLLVVDPRAELTLPGVSKSPPPSPEPIPPWDSFTL